MVDLTKTQLATLATGRCLAPSKKAPLFAELSNGGPDKDRTCDLLHAMQALSQLSYRPITHIVYQFCIEKANLFFV